MKKVYYVYFPNGLYFDSFTRSQKIKLTKVINESDVIQQYKENGNLCIQLDYNEKVKNVLDSKKTMDKKDLSKLTIITHINKVSRERGSKLTNEVQVISDLKVIKHLYKSLQDCPNTKKRSDYYFVRSLEATTPNGLLYKKVYYTIRYMFE